jgi:hypothetical protein
MSVEQLESEMEASFAIEWARSEALKCCVERFGREAVYLTWRLGWCSGQQAGLSKAQEIFK